MAYLGKVYKFDRQENFDGFVKSLGLPEDKAEILLKAQPWQKLERNGNTNCYTMSVITPQTRICRDVAFKSGVVFDDLIYGLNVKTKMILTGDTLIQILKFDKNRVFTFTKEFTTDTLKETITCNFWNGQAYRYYIAT